MNQYCLLALLVLACTSIHIRPESAQIEKVENDDDDMILGGWTTLSINEIDTGIDGFIREEVPELQYAKIIDVSTQVVAGMKYKYSYDDGNGSVWSVIVWDENWENFKQIMSIEKIEKDDWNKDEADKTSK